MKRLQRAAVVEWSAGQLVVVVVEYPAAAAVEYPAAAAVAADDPEGLREPEQAVERVRAAPEDQVLSE